MVELTYNFRR